MKKRDSSQLAMDFQPQAAAKPAEPTKAQAKRKPAKRKPAKRKPTKRKPTKRKPASSKCVKQGYRPRTKSLKCGDKKRVFACENPDHVYELTKRKRRAGDPKPEGK